MLDKYKDKNEFYSLVGIKCYSYVPSLLKKCSIFFLFPFILIFKFLKGVYLNENSKINVIFNVSF
ncbi:hypothetical protein [Spiroplasma endosymbiont of Tipula paludosa]|uniref:hypothetical protein n=1 Tax=Spiroplasma endosymbiont of Tipula paludosa TaxID=3066295 RepID=UPI0035C915F6